MKKVITSICLCFLLSSSSFGASSREDLQGRIDAAKLVLEQIMGAQDRSIPMNILEQATCVAVVPGMLKGAFVFGAQYGQGVVTCRTGHGWSAPVFIRMAGGSFGFQIGGQSTDLVLVAVNDRGFQDWRGCSRGSRAGGPQRAGRYGLADERGTAYLLAQQGSVCGRRPGRHEREPEQRGYAGILRRAAPFRVGSQGQCGSS